MASTSELGREFQKQHDLILGCRVFASTFYNISTRTVAFFFVFLILIKYSLIAVVSDLSQKQE